MMILSAFSLMIFSASAAVGAGGSLDVPVHLSEDLAARHAKGACPASDPSRDKTVKLALDAKRRIVGGSPAELREAIRKGGDLRIYTGFKYNEHIVPGDANDELIHEVSDFRVVYFVDGRWVAGIMNLRMPVVPPGIFGPAPSWSFFMYNEDGSQACARRYLDGKERLPPCGPVRKENPADMPKYRIISTFDEGSSGWSQNFVYEFESYRFHVADRWTEVYAHDAEGRTTGGDYEAFLREFRAGNDIKVAIRDFDRKKGEPTYELFTHVGSGYESTETGNFCCNSQPLVLVRPAIPMRYATGNWSYGNMIIRNNGDVAYWRCDPYTGKYEKLVRKCAVRYFVKK